jgi:hypothetical protein
MDAGECWRRSIKFVLLGGGANRKKERKRSEARGDEKKQGENSLEVPRRRDLGDFTWGSIVL